MREKTGSCQAGLIHVTIELAIELAPAIARRSIAIVNFVQFDTLLPTRWIFTARSHNIGYLRR